MDLMSQMDGRYYYVCQVNVDSNSTSSYFKCRFDDQYCCGSGCCSKPDDLSRDTVVGTWYFWSLIMIMITMFTCILISFVISSIKRKAAGASDTSWANVLLVPGQVSHLASTTLGQQGIIEPQIHYSRGNVQPQSVDTAAAAPCHLIQTRADSCLQACLIRFGPTICRTGRNRTQVLRLPAKLPHNSGSMQVTQKLVWLQHNLGEHEPPEDDPAKRSEWLDVQLMPLEAPYRSSWTGQPHSSTQHFPLELRLTTFPPGFISP